MTNEFGATQQVVRPVGILSDARACGAMAVLLGILFVGVAGFAPIEAVHDAAHDTRHSISFPCH